MAAYTVDIDVRFRDIDALGHVNNAVYATYIEQARTRYFRDVLDVDISQSSNVLASLSIDFRRPIELTDDDVTELAEIADKHDTTPGQVSLAWLQAKDNVIPIPKSSGSHLEENYRSQELELDDEDIARIDAIEREERVIDAEKGPWHW